MPARLVKRECPACHEVKNFRADVKTCGCRGTNPVLNVNASAASRQVKQPESEVIEHLRAKNRGLEADVAHLREIVGEQRELTAMVVEAVKAADPLPHPRKIDTNKSSKDVSALFVLSDLHVGEVIRADETEGMNEYNYAIAQERLFDIEDSEIKWATKQRNAYNINKAVVVLLGDYVSGDIHYELTATNEFPVPVQTAKAGLLLGEYIRRLAPHFNEVEVYEIGADNHGRLQKKPQAKQKATNSFSYLVHAITNSYCEKIPNVKITEATGAKMLINVNGWDFLAEHGDNIKSHMGFPVYGIMRSRWREATKRMKTNLGFNYYLLGHFHVPYIMENSVFGNGSLSGTSEYDHMAGRYADPAQIAMLVHPKHGAFNFTAFKA